MLGINNEFITWTIIKKNQWRLTTLCNLLPQKLVSCELIDFSQVKIVIFFRRICLRIG